MDIQCILARRTDVRSMQYAVIHTIEPKNVFERRTFEQWLQRQGAEITVGPTQTNCQIRNECFCLIH